MYSFICSLTGHSIYHHYRAVLRETGLLNTSPTQAGALCCAICTDVRAASAITQMIVPGTMHADSRAMKWMTRSMVLLM
jgi:hypothetical protein